MSKRENEEKEVKLGHGSNKQKEKKNPSPERMSSQAVTSWNTSASLCFVTFPPHFGSFFAKNFSLAIFY